MNKLLLLILLFSLQAKGTITGISAVNLEDSYDLENPHVFATGKSSIGDLSQYIGIIADKGKGDSSAPHIVYIPFHGLNSQSDYTVASVAGDGVTGPNADLLPQATTGNIEADKNFLAIKINIAGVAGTNYLYAAVKNSSGDYEYFIPDLPGLPTQRYLQTVTSSADHLVYFDLEKMCSSSSANCTLNNQSKDFNIVLFTSTDNNKSGTATVPTEALYYTLKASNSLESTATVLSDLLRGDSSLTAVVSGIVGKPYLTYSFLFTGEASVVANSSVSNIVANNFEMKPLKSFKEDGEILISGLVNDQKYTVLVGQVDKYLFSTPLSAGLIQTPIAIETLLKGENCYLLSAGFQRKHYVINYFKMIRDTILLKNEWGKRFVHFYYTTAPRFTKTIYQSDLLSALMRGLGYSFYFIFNFFIYILAGLLLLAFLAWKKYGRA